MSAVGLLPGFTVKAAINLFTRTDGGILSCIFCIIEVLLAIKVAATYALGYCTWYLYLIIAVIAKCLAISGPKR